MLQSVSHADAIALPERNTEPFIDEAGLLTRSRGEGTPDLPQELTDGAYIVEDDYGRIWSSGFFRGHTALLAGPPHPATERFANRGFLAVPFRQVPRRFVTSRQEFLEAVAFLRRASETLYPKRVVVYRGQTQEHYLTRSAEERMRLFGSTDVLEPSLRPSGARRKEISAPATAVWAQLVQWHVAHTRNYAPAHRYTGTDLPWSFATAAGRYVTLAFAQHYGLPTPALDVTSDLQVALWFALHTFTGSGALKAMPANGGEGVVYVIAAEKAQHFSEATLPTHALRPERQHGGFLASNWGNCRNRITRYLVGAVYFPHALLEEIAGDLPAASHLFPGPREDRFVHRIQEVAWFERRGSALLSEIAEHVYWVEGASNGRLDVPIKDLGDSRSDAELASLAEAGDAAAAYRLARRCKALEDGAGAERWSRIAALQGHLEAAAMLGFLLSSHGDPEGELWTRTAASAGQRDAQNNLGLLHAQRGNVDEAAKWYERAARAGNNAAAYNLGTLLLRNGRAAEAEHWLTISANGGDPDAACNLGKIFRERNDLQGAEHWFRVAIAGGVRAAAYNLGMLCAGAGRIDEAREWLGQAAAAGDPDAPYRLARLDQRE